MVPHLLLHCPVVCGIGSGDVKYWLVMPQNVGHFLHQWSAAELPKKEGLEDKRQHYLMPFCGQLD